MRFRNKEKLIFILVIITASLILLTACAKNAEKNNTKDKLVIAEQYGIAYAPVQLIKELKLLESANPDLKVEWKQLSNTAAIRESMLAGDVDIAFMAIPPFLIAKDKGMDWKIISGLSQTPLSLMVNREYINSLADFKTTDKIALPQPGSIQHILLSMAAKKQFDDSKKFDSQLITLNHPDAMNALLAQKEVAAHFASPPYLFLESKEAEIKEILRAQEAFGKEFTFIVGVSSPEFYENNPSKYQLFRSTLNTALDKFKNEKAEIAGILADNYGLEAAELRNYLAWPGMDYNSQIKGLATFIDFMSSEGYLTKDYHNLKELVFNSDLIYQGENKKDEQNNDKQTKPNVENQAEEVDSFAK